MFIRQNSPLLRSGTPDRCLRLRLPPVAHFATPRSKGVPGTPTCGQLGSGARLGTMVEHCRLRLERLSRLSALFTLQNHSLPVSDAIPHVGHGLTGRNPDWSAGGAYALTPCGGSTGNRSNRHGMARIFHAFQLLEAGCTSDHQNSPLGTRKFEAVTSSALATIFTFLRSRPGTVPMLSRIEALVLDHRVKGGRVGSVRHQRQASEDCCRCCRPFGSSITSTHVARGC